jgi:NAD(P)H-nitrite reductase large subunit
MRFVIVGGGIAGVSAAEEIRKLQPDADIVLVSGEHHPLYSRVLLPHYVKGKVPRERCFLKKETWYAEQKIEWLPGTYVESCDPKNSFVLLSDGRELEYDKLLIATGGDVKTMGENLRGVSYFRTLDDADHILQLVQEHGKDAKAAVYGGGFISCEYVNAFVHFGLSTTVAFRGGWMFSRTLDEESGELVNEHLRSKGVVVKPDALFLGVEGDTALSALMTDQGGIPCDILGIGTGIEGDFGWVKDAGIEVGTGIKTNDFLETNVPNIFAAGDVAEFSDAIVGRQLVVGNWMSANMQGRAVGKTMAGERTQFRLVSSYATNALGLEMIFVGDVHREAADEIRVVGSKAAGGVAQLFVRKGKLVGATLVNRNGDRAIVTKAIQDQKAIGEISLG